MKYPFFNDDDRDYIRSLPVKDGGEWTTIGELEDAVDFEPDFSDYDPGPDCATSDEYERELWR